MANKTCLVCGTALTNGAMFCPKCGTKYEPPKEEEKQKPIQAVLIRKIVYGMKEAAIALNISPRKLQTLVANGEIVACRQGGNIGITEWALEAYAKSKEVAPSEATSLRGNLKII